MASGTTRIADVIVPEIFTPYTQQLTEEKSRLIRSGALALDPFLSSFLAGGGLTVHAPSWKDLDNDEDNVSSDDPAVTATPNKTATLQEIAVRLSRNNSWKTADLTEALAGSDPADSIANRVADYWVRRMQAVFIATMKGVFADNDAAPAASEHTAGDLTYDASGTAYVDNVTNFSAENYINAKVTMGDSMDQLSLLMVHSIVYARMQKNNMIDFVPDSNQQIIIPRFLGAEVIMDDAMPFSNGVFESWLFAPAAVRMGTGAPKVPTETERYPAEGNGGGTEALFNRVEWCMHPKGHRYDGSPPNGGPSNAATSNNLAHAASWKRVFTERKQIKIARLKTRES